MFLSSFPFSLFVFTHLMFLDVSDFLWLLIVSLSICFISYNNSSDNNNSNK